MKATVIRKFGDVDVLKYEDIETPKPKPGYILVKVLAAGVNRFDHYIREGSVVPELPFPHILGSDGAGEVAELGEGVTGFETGERVVPVPGYPLNESFALPGLGIWGTYAQYMEAPAPFVLKDNTGLPPEEVATLPVPLGTAVRSVKEVGQVKAGDKVLVQSGASSSGSVQI
jgi:NADPH:quinone reductase-like Zn-dependent oxidoreductase